MKLCKMRYDSSNNNLNNLIHIKFKYIIYLTRINSHGSTIRILDLYRSFKYFAIYKTNIEIKAVAVDTQLILTNNERNIFI